MKYEMIFGDEALFDGAPDDVDMIGYNGGFYKNSQNGPMYCCGCTFTTDEYRNKGFIAMRRIIKEPKRWTWEDKKAGRLPEVGSKLIYTETGDQFSFVGVIAGSMRWACKDACDGLLYFFERSEMSPIESPEEKAARLKSEWCAKAAKQLKNLEYTSTLTSIYDALLSGELKAPESTE